MSHSKLGKTVQKGKKRGHHVEIYDKIMIFLSVSHSSLFSLVQLKWIERGEEKRTPTSITTSESDDYF